MAVRIAQLTDLHLTAREVGRVWGSDVWRNLDRALACVERELAPVDRLVLTGDLANNGSAEAYARLADRLAPFGARVRLLPGNHDHRERLRAAFPAQWEATAPRLVFADAVGDVRLLGLDSLCQGRTRGQLDDWQLAWLRAQLAADARPYVVFVHHPPVRVRTWWLDKDLLRERDALRAALAPRPPRAIFAGHVHHEFVGEFAGVPVTTTPAVAYQYGVRTWLPLPRSRAPGLRVIELGENEVTSRAVRC